MDLFGWWAWARDYLVVRWVRWVGVRIKLNATRSRTFSLRTLGEVGPHLLTRSLPMVKIELPLRHLLCELKIRSTSWWQLLPRTTKRTRSGCTGRRFTVWTSLFVARLLGTGQVIGCMVRNVQRLPLLALSWLCRPQLGRLGLRPLHSLPGVLLYMLIAMLVSGPLLALWTRFLKKTFLLPLKRPRMTEVFPGSIGGPL